MPGLDDPAGPPREGVRAQSGSSGSAVGGSSRGAFALDEVGEGAPPGERHHTARVDSSQGPQSADRPPKVVAQTDDPMIGTVIAGRYRVDSRLGEGGMGAVYLVEHTLMRKKLALKVLHREMCSQTEIVARFEREAMAAAHIDHPNVAGATDFGKLEDGSFYLVLEYVEGTSLRTLIDKGPLAAPRAVHVTVQILAALRRAHELGIVHRDLKPENILLFEKDGDPDFVKVLDFGIARVPIGSLISGGDSGPSLTRAGMVYGTPEYMAPEQALGQNVDGRSDIYGTGVMLFEMLTGRRPYDNKDKVALLGQHVAGAIPSLRERAPTLMLPIELEQVVTKLLSKSPSDRYADAAEAMQALLDVPLEGGVLIASSRTPSRRGFEQSGSFRTGNSGPVIIHSEAVPALTQERAFQTAETQRPPAPDSTPPLRRRPMGMIVAVAGVAVVLIVAAIFYVRGKGKANDDESDPRRPVATATASNSGSTPLMPALTPDELKDQANKALARADGGDPQGLADLEALATAHTGQPVVLIDLAKAYSHAKRHVEAIGAVKRLVTASPESANDPALNPIIDAALPSSADTVFNLLTKEMGAEGTPILFDIGYGNRGPSNLRSRGKAALAEPEVQKVLTPNIRGALELMKAGSCDAKHKVLDTYRKDLDARVLPFLKPLTATRGCGSFFKNQDCWPCLHAAKYLDTVIKEIEARVKASKGTGP
jgi:serine/threonine protein kinase